MKRIHTHYDNLKVTRNAPPEIIRAAFKALSQKFHPDRHGGDARATQTFQLITAAYEVLSDPQRRRQHDEWIARAERKIQGEAAAAADRQARRPWNGRERRRTPWPEIRSSAPAAVMTSAGRIRMPVRALALWIATALVTVMLLTLANS
jgi:curved DNA-binding protein CbpA